MNVRMIKCKYVGMYACKFNCASACMYEYLYGGNILMNECMHACMKHEYMYVCMNVCNCE